MLTIAIDTKLECNSDYVCIEGPSVGGDRRITVIAYEKHLLDDVSHPNLYDECGAVVRLCGGDFDAYTTLLSWCEKNPIPKSPHVLNYDHKAPQKTAKGLIIGYPVIWYDLDDTMVDYRSPPNHALMSKVLIQLEKALVVEEGNACGAHKRLSVNTRRLQEASLTLNAPGVTATGNEVSALRHILDFLMQPSNGSSHTGAPPCPPDHKSHPSNPTS